MESVLIRSLACCGVSPTVISGACAGAIGVRVSIAATMPHKIAQNRFKNRARTILAAASQPVIVAVVMFDLPLVFGDASDGRSHLPYSGRALGGGLSPDVPLQKIAGHLPEYAD